MPESVSKAEKRHEKAQYVNDRVEEQKTPYINMTSKDLIMREEWNQLTLPQMEDELKSRGLIVEREILTEWDLRLKLRIAVFLEQQKAERLNRETMELKREDLLDNDCDDDETEESQEEYKFIFTKNHGQTMIF